jgi:uncharacterized protein YbjT (DUF2867 family)
MSRFVIAGATGRVGSAVARRLIDAGHAVTIVTRSADRGAALGALGAEVAVGTLADTAFLARILEGATAFFAILPEPLDAKDFHVDRRRTADAIAGAISASPLSHVVVLSSVGAHTSDNMGPISDLHYFEKAILDTGKAVTVIRASMFQDYVASAIEPARAMGIFPNLQPTRDVGIPMVAIRDVAVIAANALLQAPPRANTVVDVLGPSYSPREVAATLGHALGRSIEIIDIPSSERVSALARAGLPLPFARVVAELQDAIAGGRIKPVGDRREIGTTTLEQTLSGILGATPPVLAA